MVPVKGREVAVVAFAPVASTIAVLLSYYALGSVWFYVSVAALLAVGVALYFLKVSWYKRTAGMLFAAGTAGGLIVKLKWDDVHLAWTTSTSAIPLVVGLGVLVVEAWTDARASGSPAAARSAGTRIASGNKGARVSITNLEVTGAPRDAQVAADNVAEEEVRIDRVAVRHREDD